MSFSHFLQVEHEWIINNELLNLKAFVCSLEPAQCNFLQPAHIVQTNESNTAGTETPHTLQGVSEEP